MKKNIYLLFIVVFLLISNFSKIKADEISRKENIGIYVFYDYGRNSNDTSWVDNEIRGEGTAHDIGMSGLGFRYFPTQKMFIDVVFREMESQTVIGSVNTIINNTRYNPVIQRMDSHGIIINYLCLDSNKIDIFAGLGHMFQKMQINPYGGNIYGNDFNIYFNNWIFRVLGEHKIGKRAAVNLSLIYEQNIKLDMINNNGRIFHYNYSPLVIIEPSIVVYF
ncbi:MAG: hypothetical protein JW871_00340 [Endomicrobiales bacterium]|nr:hypothetical protein [Endomicrobiales bacterium]